MLHFSFNHMVVVYSSALTLSFSTLRSPSSSQPCLVAKDGGSSSMAQPVLLSQMLRRD